MPSVTYNPVATTNGSASSFSGTVSPVGEGMTPSSLYLFIDNGLGGYNGIGFGVADNGSGQINLPDGDGFSGINFGTGDGVTTTFTTSLNFGFVEPGSVNVYDNGVLSGTDNGSGGFGSGGGPQTETFPGSGANHTYNKTVSPNPIVSGTVVLKVSGGVTLATDNGSGGLIASGGSTITAGTINYSTGAISWHDSTDRTSVNLELLWTNVGGLSGTVNYTPGNMTVTFPTAPAMGDPLTFDVTGYGAIGTIDYATGAFSFQTGNSSPIVGATGFRIYFNYEYTAIPPTPVAGAPGLPLVPVVPPTLAALLQAINSSFGVDVLCLTDLDPNFSLVQNALPQDVWHLISERPGSIFWSPNQTFSVWSMLSKGIMPATLAATAATIQAVVASDERVAQVQCNVTQSGPEAVRVQLQVFPEQGAAFQLVAAVNKVTITLISVGLVNL